MNKCSLNLNSEILNAAALVRVGVVEYVFTEPCGI